MITENDGLHEVTLALCRGEGPCVTGPGCDGEEVCLDDEADEENEE